MDRLERKIINGYLAKRKATICSLSQVDRVTDLIRKLRPVRTLHEMVRLGPPRDGGYLVPNDLEGVVACFSPGVGEEYEFEVDCLNRGMKVFMADASVNKPVGLPEACQFRKKFVGSYSHEEYITLDQWVSEDLPHTEGEDGDLLLQMDIEGAEYDVLHASLSNGAGTYFICRRSFRS